MSMRRFFNLINFLFFFASMFAAQMLAADSRDRFEYVAGRGLEIHTNPQGARVFIDGIERGITPFFTGDLPAETYNVVLRKETYADREFEAVVLSNSRLVVTMEIEIALGFVDVYVYREEGSPDSLPFNPQVNARGADKTISSITLSSGNTVSARLPIGKQTIHARAFGWEDASVIVSVSGQNPTTAEIYMKPAVFKIEKAAQSRKRFNPLNSSNLGVTEYRFEVSAPGTGTIKILDSNDNIVYTRNFKNFNTWVQEITWNGTDSEGNLLPQGNYVVLIEASPLPQINQGEEIKTLRLKTEINYSLNIFPLSLESGISGLSFAPMPHTLPAGSFQVSADINFSRKTMLPDADTYNEYSNTCFPFKLNFRITPIERLEAAAVLNINPYIEQEIGWGLSGSAKYNFMDGNSFPLAFSAGASFSWANNTRNESSGEYPLSPGKGAGLYAPLSLELDELSIVFCPAAYWTLPENIIPRLLLSAGIMYQFNWLNTGLSARYEINFEEKKETRILTGVEINLFPPPSNIIYFIQGGVWFKETSLGYYAGLGIGLIY